MSAEPAAERKHNNTPEECMGRVPEGYVCSRCGGKLEPIATVDNSGTPTYWPGCMQCMVFNYGRDPKVVRVAKQIVGERPLIVGDPDTKVGDRVDEVGRIVMDALCILEATHPTQEQIEGAAVQMMDVAQNILSPGYRDDQERLRIEFRKRLTKWFGQPKEEGMGARHRHPHEGKDFWTPEYQRDHRAVVEGIVGRSDESFRGFVESCTYLDEFAAERTVEETVDANLQAMRGG